MNAFDVLLRHAESRSQGQQQQQSGGKKRRSGSDPNPARPSTARRYATCPICEMSVPCHFIDLHTLSCAKVAPAAAAASRTPTQAAAVPGSSTNPPDAARQQQQQQKLSIPQVLCYDDGPARPPTDAPNASPPASTSSELPQRLTPSNPPPPTQPPAGCQAAAQTFESVPMQLPVKATDQHAIHAPHMELMSGTGDHVQHQDRAEMDFLDTEEDCFGDQGTASQGGSAQACRDSKSKDAFQVLMEGQRRQQPAVHVFFMELTREGSWRWHWWQKAPAAGRAAEPLQLPECRWAATTSVSLARAGGGAGAGTATLQLQSNVAPGEGGAVSWAAPGLLSNGRVPPEGRWRGATSALKSALQKNIRLGRAPCAVRCAMQLLKDDAGELLRRLPVICMEDAIMQPGLPFLVWLMAAHAKGYVVGQAACSELLRLTYDMASVRVRDYLPPLSMCPGRMLRSLGEADADMPPAEAALVKALLLRASYGGMADDVAMLRGYAGFWAERFRERGGASEPPGPAPAPEGTAARDALQPATGRGDVERQAVLGAAAESRTDRSSSDAARAGQESLPDAQSFGCVELNPDTCVTRGQDAARAAANAGQQPSERARWHDDHAASLLRQEPAVASSSGACVAATPLDRHASQHSGGGGEAEAGAGAQEAYFSLCLASREGGDPEPGTGTTPLLPAHTASFTSATQLMSDMKRDQQALQQALCSPSHQHLRAGPEPASASGTSGAQRHAHGADERWRDGSAQAEVPGARMAAPDQAEPAATPGADIPLLPGEAGTTQCRDQAGLPHPPPPSSTWLKFINSLYRTQPPPQLVHAASVGPLRLADVPLSAIDFHVSDVVPHLLGLPAVHAAAAQLTCNSWGIEGQPEACLRSAMWLFRSSLNSRRWLHALYNVEVQQGGVQDQSAPCVPYEHVRLLEDLESDVAKRERLQPLWDAAAAPADSFSRGFIRRRFQP